MSFSFIFFKTFFFFFFLLWTIFFKLLIEFVTILLVVCCGVLAINACGILVPGVGMEPAPAALKGEMLTTGPPGKSRFEGLSK